MVWREWKRFAAWLLVGALLCTLAGGVAFADEETPAQDDTQTDASMADAAGTDEAAETDETIPGTHLIRTDVVELGKVPNETKTEERCDVLLVADMATGVAIHEKNTQLSIPVSGAVVQLMTILAALDHVSLDETVVITEEHLKDIPRSNAKLGLAVGNKVVVSDLVVAMLYGGAIDAARVLADEAAQRAGVGGIGVLMAQKAAQLGMTSTEYAFSDGVGSEVVMTTAVDQCELYMEALGNDALLDLMKAGVYVLRSEREEVVEKDGEQAADEEAAQTEADEGNKKKTAKVKMREINKNLPLKLTNAVAAVVPENRLYDVRLSSAVTCLADSSRNDERYNAVIFHSMDARSDMAILYWVPQASNTVAVKNLYNLADIFSRRKVIDLIPYIEVAANGLTVEKNGVKISGWFLKEGHVMYGRQMAAYDPEAKDAENAAASKDDYVLANMKIVLKPDTGTLITSEDGSRQIAAKVMVDNSVEGTVTLATAPKAVQTEVSQNTNTVYTDDDIIPPEPTLMSQYGWIIIICGVVLLGMIVIILGVVIRNRMER